MGTIKRLVRFTGGSLIGGAVGTVTATLLAPHSGHDLQRRLRDRIRRAQLAGATAKAEKEDELITRFRGSVADPTALEEEKLRAREEVAAAVQAVGLGLNAPGAIAAHDANRPQ